MLKIGTFMYTGYTGQKYFLQKIREIFFPKICDSFFFKISMVSPKIREAKNLHYVYFKIFNIYLFNFGNGFLLQKHFQ